MNEQAFFASDGRAGQRERLCLRITTFGTFHLTWIDPSTGQEIPLPAERLQGRGAAPALGLLKALLCRPHRFATRDWLLEQFWPEITRRKADERLDDVASGLRTLLRQPGSDEKILHFVYGSNGKGNGYRLEAYPAIWVDADAFEWYMKQAGLMERFGDDPLPFLESAYQLGERGTFLAEELYSQWSQERRRDLDGQYSQCVHRMAECYRQRGALLQAERCLRTYWVAHLIDEDALRPLLQILGEQDRYQEAQACYQRTGEALAELGREPDVPTQDLIAYFKTKHITCVASRKTSALVSSTTMSHEIMKQPPLSTGRNEPPTTQIIPETRHLIGRQMWLAQIHDLVQAVPAKKLIIVQGPVGMGKSSELTRFARVFQQCEEPRYRVLWLPFQTGEWSTGPDAALDVILGTLLTECHIAPFPSDAPRERLITALLHYLEQSAGPTVILLDNAECLLESNGLLAPCWEMFLTRFLRSQHQATLILATKEWHGWPGRERAFLAETSVPPLTEEESINLLQRLGLSSVPVEHLRAVGAQLAGIPLLLEWTATVVVDPLLLDQWEGVDESEALFQTQTTQAQLVGRLQRLLQDPDLLGTHLASKLAPLLKRIVEQHLSDEARLVLAKLSVATLPLEKVALQVLCPRPRLLKELRDASLLAAYSNRVQLLPIVALTVQQQLTPERRREVEEAVIEAYTRWLDDGHLEMQEAGNVVTELAVLLLGHRKLLEVAQLVVRLGWCSFNLGHGPRLAHLAQITLRQVDWHDTEEHECAGLVLLQILFQFLGQPVDPTKYADYQRIWNAIADKKVILPVAIGIYVTHLLMLNATNNASFEEAQALLHAYSTSLKQKTVLLGEEAFLFKVWSDYVEVQGNKQQARHLREQAIILHRQLALQLSSQKETVSFEEEIRKKRLASCLNNLAYNLNMMGMHEEALLIVEQSIPLKEQGYVYIGALAASYGEKAEILMALGRYQEALVFDEKAMAEILCCAGAGDALSQKEKWIYQVNRGRLYLRLGRVDEAERLLQDAIPHIHPKRRMYHMLAKDGLNEIEQWRQQSTTAQHQLDWRWIGRYRELCTYDSRWWLTWAGPFTEQEQEQWDQLFALPLDEVTKKQLGTLMKVSRERELEAALTEQREPCLHYPAIAIEDIRHRIEAQLALREEISQQEPNVIVRRFYQDAIEEELDYLHLIEATYERNTERFWECNRRLFPLPSKENMLYSFTRVKHIVKQGLENPETAEISLQLQEFIHTHLHLSLDLTPEEETHPERIRRLTTPPQQQRVPAHTVQRFFTTILQEGGYADWQVSIDQNATNARVEQGARHIYLPEKYFLLSEIKHLFIHELAGHAARCIAGTHSPLGLLGIHTKNCLPTDEGLALYYEHQAAMQRGDVVDDSGRRMSTLALGLACGVMTPPQTFRSLVTFFELYSLLVRLLEQPEANKEKLQKQARQYALSMCLRKYRGVPDLKQAGVCYLQDVLYLHGFRLIKDAVTQGETVLDRLAVGNVALEQLPDLQELGIVSTPQPFKKLVFDPNLDSYILSFTQSEDDNEIRR